MKERPELTVINGNVCLHIYIWGINPDTSKKVGLQCCVNSEKYYQSLSKCPLYRKGRSEK